MDIQTAIQNYYHIYVLSPDLAKQSYFNFSLYIMQWCGKSECVCVITVAFGRNFIPGHVSERRVKQPSLATVHASVCVRVCVCL